MLVIAYGAKVEVKEVGQVDGVVKPIESNQLDPELGQIDRKSVV